MYSSKLSSLNTADLPMFHKSTIALIEKSSSKSINGVPEECI